MTPDEAYRDALSWFRAQWDPQLSLRQWWRLLAESGWGFPTWPEQFFGKGLDPAAGKAVARARNEVGAFPAPLGIATMMVAPTLMEVGTPEQQQRYLPGIADGSDVWCQLFSEPGAGSDLAGVQTRAVRDGDEWVVNGQKVWTSGGHYATRAILVARTDVEVPKHAGLSFFLIEDMAQPGIEVRPLRQMTGTAEFNEVFLTDARVRHENLVGELGGGWGVALRVLGHERDSLDADADGGGIMGDLDLDRPVGDYQSTAEHAADDGTGPLSLTQGQAALDLIAELVDHAGRRNDPLARQTLATVATKVRLARFNGGALPASAGKLAATDLMRNVRDSALELLGAQGALVGEQSYRDGLVAEMALWSPGLSIAGGTDEIQRNIIGERELGLPPEPRVDKNLPFKELNQPVRR